MRLVYRLAVAASFAVSGVAGIAAPALAQQTVTVGTTLTKVTFADGWFEQQPNGSWTEFNAQGRPVYYFREQSRTEDAVRLLDPSRNTAVEFNMPRQIVRISFNGSPFEDLYPITATRHRNAVPVAPLRPTGPITTPPVRLSPDAVYATQTQFKVEAGAITSDAEARQKCPALAARVGGTWDRGWERRDGVKSVCILAFPHRPV